MGSLNIFSQKFQDLVKSSDLKITQLENVDPETVEILPMDRNFEGENILTCSYCLVKFVDISAQRAHYKLDWHRFNLKRSLLKEKPVTEEEFIKKNDNDDLSSISGSDSEEENYKETYLENKGKIIFQNEEGQVISIYRGLLWDKKEERDLEITNTLLNSRLKNVTLDNRQWTVFMLGGGHFAGAVFKENIPILHKTFHCYTVRQGQGGSQSSKDNKSGGSHPKSAGASLRRYNEQALVQHVRDIVSLWKSEIESSSVIIIRAPGPYNRLVLFGGNPPLLQKSDTRIRTIPFSTRRPTYKEVQRVHSLFATASVYDSLEHAIDITKIEKNFSKNAKRTKTLSPSIDRAKCRETIQRPLPVPDEPSSTDEEAESSEDAEMHFSSNDQEVSFENLEIFSDDCPFPIPKGDNKVKKKKPRKSKSKKLKEKEDARKEELKKVLITGNLIKLVELFNNSVSNSNEDVKEDLRTTFVNEILDEDGNSFLHLAAMNEHPETIRFLLENDADPCLKNKKNQTPYTSTQSKDVRETMRNFGRDFPEKYNYSKAQIPLNALTAEELAEKKKRERKIKREKEKVKKKENEIKKKENEEMERFKKLSDREKRALAAERRILSQSGSVISRCFLCATDITGKVPFEYGENRFCTMECLKAHRFQTPTTFS